MTSLYSTSAIAFAKTFAAARSVAPSSEPSLPLPGSATHPVSSAPPAVNFAALGRLSPAAQWFQSPVLAQLQNTAPSAAPIAPAPATGPGGIPLAQIGQNLDGIRMRSDERDLGVQPNFIALNEIASANTPAKREAFKALKKAQGKLKTAEDRLAARKETLETRQNAVEGLDVQLGDRSMRLAAQKDRVKELETDLAKTKEPEARSALTDELRDARADLRSTETELRTLRTQMSGAKTALSRAERDLKTAETGVANARRDLNAEAGRFTQWVKDHGLSHNRELRALNGELADAQRELRQARARRADAGTIQGIENRIEFIQQQRLGKTNELQARIDDFEPLVSVQQNHHDFTVAGERVRLHDNVVTYATDTPEGLEGRSDNDGQATVAARLAASGLSADKQSILGIVSGHEGTFSTINTWDRAKVTAGFLQWTLGEEGNGSLVGLMSEIKRRDPAAYRERFQSYGLDVSGGRVELTRPDGTVLRGADAAEAIQRDPKLAAVLSRAGTDPRIQDVQVAHGAATKIDAMRAARVSAGNQAVSLAQVLSSEYGVGLMTDRAVHSGEGAVKNTVRRALERFMQANPQADLSNPAWAARAEAQVVAALEAMDPQRARSFAHLSHQRGSFNP